MSLENETPSRRASRSLATGGMLALLFVAAACRDPARDASSPLHGTSANAGPASSSKQDASAASAITTAASAPPRCAPRPPAARRHGTWVYAVGGKPLMEDDGIDRLAEFAESHSLNEVYVSGAALPLSDARTPKAIEALHRRGLRVEALLETGDAVARVVDVGRSAPGCGGFDGVHLDLEPWIGRGTDASWVAPLASAYRAARSAASEAGLGFAADISAVKYEHLDAADRARLLDAASTLVLMAYEAPLATVYRRCDPLFDDGRQPGGSLLVATRVKDFGATDHGHSPRGACQNGAALASLDARYERAANYAGWATFAYNQYLDPAICPAGCCALEAERRP